MSRVLLATFGSLGDLHPYLAVGRALQAQGHQALIATSPEYEAAVTAAGLQFAPVRPSLDALGSREALARRLFDPLRGVKRLLCDVVLPHLHEAHEDIARASQGCDLLVSHPLTFAVPIVAGQLAKPWLSSVLAPMSFMSRHEPAQLAGINALQYARRLGPWAYELAERAMRRTLRAWEQPLRRFRAGQGLPDQGEVQMLEGQFSPFGTLALFDSVLAQPQPDWPQGVQVCGAALHDGPVAHGADAQRLRRFLEAGDPPLVFALGSSAVWFADGFWSRAVEAANQLGRRAVLLTGRPMLQPLPPTMVSFEYLPYSQIFPCAAAIVHQAGIGTLSQALRAGRPQLLVPVGFDQPDNAARARRLGVAQVLPFARTQARRMAESLEALLKGKEVSLAAAQIGRQLRDSDDGSSRAAARIQQLL